MKKTHLSSRVFKWLFMLSVTLLFVQCGSDKKTFVKEPIDDIIKNNSTASNFSIILYDMDYDEASNKYKHQYQLLVEPAPPLDTTIIESKTTWLVVSDAFFDKHVDDMGMEIAFKKNGKVEKKTAPPGYANHVGNEKYGSWQTNSGGNSFWAFYGRYAFMSSLFGMNRYPMYRSGYNNYYSNYYGSGRSYYGSTTSNGRSTYGTKGSYNSSTRKSSTWNSKPSSFKNNVRSKAKRSASTSKRSRSSSRYQNSRSRSRSGGHGK